MATEIERGKRMGGWLALYLWPGIVLSGVEIKPSLCWHGKAKGRWMSQPVRSSILLCGGLGWHSAFCSLLCVALRNAENSITCRCRLHKLSTRGKRYSNSSFIERVDCHKQTILESKVRYQFWSCWFVWHSYLIKIGISIILFLLFEFWCLVTSGGYHRIYHTSFK